MRHTFALARVAVRCGFTLLELLVVVVILLAILCLLLPAGSTSRIESRGTTCRHNLVQLQQALAQREATLGELPGYVNNLGTKGTRNQIRASWVVFTFPYIEQPELWEKWSNPNGIDSASVITTNGVNAPELEILICPSDPPATWGLPVLSYAANAGWIQRSHSLLGGIRIPAESPFQSTREENPANGVFIDRSRVLNTEADPNLGPNLIGTKDCFDDFANPVVPVAMTMAYIQKNDGANSTIMLAENLHQVHWAFTDSSDYTSSTSGIADEKWHFGVCWEQPDTIKASGATDDEYRRRPNGDLSEDSYSTIGDITRDDLDDPDSDPDYRRAFPSSRHPAGINVAFVGGSVRFISDSIEPRVYAQLMTSNRHMSDLVVERAQETKLKRVEDHEY